MSTSIDILRIRKTLGTKTWFPPKQYGPDGWHLTSRSLAWTVIVSAGDWDGVEYIHASIAGFDELPSYSQLKELHQAVFGDGYSYMVFPPPEHHVNIQPHALHLYGRLDGTASLPEFSDKINGVNSI